MAKQLINVLTSKSTLRGSSSQLYRFTRWLPWTSLTRSLLSGHPSISFVHDSLPPTWLNLSFFTFPSTKHQVTINHPPIPIPPLSPSMPSPLHAHHLPPPRPPMAHHANHHPRETWRTSTFSEDGYPSSFTHSGHKAYNVEVDMARELITADSNSRPKHFHNVFEEVIFVFTVMMATACTVSAGFKADGNSGCDWFKQTFIQGVVNINTVTIGRDLLMTPAQITWITAAIGYFSLLSPLIFRPLFMLYRR